MTATCTECGATFERQRSPRCLPCRDRERLAYQRDYENRKRERLKAELARQPAIVQEAHRLAELAAWRERYRGKNPLPICPGCQRPTTRRNQLTCDDCCTDLEARILKRERARRARWAKLAGLHHLCKDCDAKVDEPRYRRCAACRAKVTQINYWQQYAARETPEEREERLAFLRAKYRALHPAEPCESCGKPKQHNLKRECDACAPTDEEARVRRRDAKRRQRAAARAKNNQTGCSR